MMIRRRVQKGVVVLEAPGALSDGTDVVIKPLPPTDTKGNKRAKRPTVSRALVNLAGKAENLPPDSAKNVDHRLYGHAKQ
jgi:hypothetical protein